LSVDPQKSTGKLGREGESFLWWSAFLAGYFLFSILLIAWYLFIYLIKESKKKKKSY